MIFVANLGETTVDGYRAGGIFITDAHGGIVIPDDDCTVLAWRNAQRNGKIMLVGDPHPTEAGRFKPIRTFVPNTYYEYICPGGCRDGHEAFAKPADDDHCPRCGDERTLHAVVNGIFTSKSMKISKRDASD